MKALIVEGGAMRGIFSAGILDAFIEQDYFDFDWFLGVSAGASNVAAYLGKQHGRNYRVYTDYCLRPQFKQWRRFLRGGDLIDIDWLWDITERELPLDLAQLEERAAKMLAVLTCAQSGDPHYLSPQAGELFQLIKASGTMPFAYKGKVELRGRQWFDGGVADSIPVAEAYRRGARQMLILRSNPASYRKKAYGLKKLFPLLLRKYPGIARRLQQRHDDYNRALDFIHQPPADCEIHQICPPEDFAADQFTTDTKVLHTAYLEGVQRGRNWLHNPAF
ncbi:MULTISPECIES: patatin-like phospholipase family protein [unclassified Thalassolituus]|uniref:patatin-like phospholipase family protein n=1 Tax=unclassified Thalassolituus TaxID=2624967 RepID=UPI000C0BA09A|nr:MULTISPECIES: patatin family protein [unclassified Thalassolituus]MAK91089.1 patatin family protein [Thalassolituus sp.]|tara:strand:+ start:3787 stop:4617 length:831 start_codon:yes stop_codon:yes gene_type:complete